MTRTGRATARRFAPSADGRLVAQTWLGSRAILLVVAVVVMTGYHRTFSQVTGNWDVQHYMSIARNGYADPLEMAFFPGLPALLKGGSFLGIPMEVTGVLLGQPCLPWSDTPRHLSALLPSGLGSVLVLGAGGRQLSSLVWHARSEFLASS